jgi:ribonucleoside-diphosphate reductase alpha chain
MNIQDTTQMYFDQLHMEKYRDTGQSKEQHNRKLSKNLSSNQGHENKIYDILSNNRFLPAGRVQAALGAGEREVSPFNCTVSQTINDDMLSIMNAVTNAAMILRLGTGIGYNFSNIRPKGDLIVKLQTKASGPLSFMEIFDIMASTIASSGHRRGAQMGVLDVSHPDIEAFIDAKLTPGKYRQFNLSVNCTSSFMAAVKSNSDWDLTFNGKVYKTLKAKYLWDKIVHTAYESAEPGVLFLDTTNENNNLYYCEEIRATNPCSEQGLPEYGLCTLGSFNLVGYLIKKETDDEYWYSFDFDQFEKDIHTIVEAYDNIFDKAIYAIPQHKEEAIAKRRMGLGLTGIANAIEAMAGEPCYGDPDFCDTLDEISRILCHTAYKASVDLAKNRGCFPKFHSELYTNSKFIKSLPVKLQEDIKKYGIRNSHLISYAPCGTISQCAGNVSSGVEPVFHYKQKRKVHMQNGQIDVIIQDYGQKFLNVEGRTLEDCSVEDHVNVACICQKYCDSAVSKTVNVAATCLYDDYARIYMDAYDCGLKGITVYRPTQLRGSVIVKADEVTPNNDEDIEPTAPTNCKNGVCEM